MKNIKLLEEREISQKQLAESKAAPIGFQINEENESSNGFAVRLIAKTLTMAVVTLVAILLTSAISIKALVKITKFSTQLFKRTTIPFIQLLKV